MSLSVDQALRRAARHAKKGEIDVAVQKYTSVLEKDPSNQQAIDGLKKLQQPKANFAQQKVSELVAMYHQGSFQEALAHGEALARQFPDMPFIPNLLGAVNVGLGHLEHAAANYATAVQIKPDYAEAHNNMGNVLLDLGQPEMAVSSLTKALQIKPDFAEAHNNLGNVLNDLGKPAEAAASYDRAIQIEPDFVEAHNNLGNALQTLGKTAMAVTSYDRALQIRPDFAEAHSNMGNALRVLGQPENAISSLTRSLQIKPNFADAHNNLGNALSDLDRPEEAIDSYNKALRIKPDYAEAHSNLGKVLNNLGKSELALSSLNKALQVRPDFAEAHNNLGNALYDLGKLEEALASYNKALHLNAGYAEAYNNLGNTLKTLGKPEEAVVSFKKALPLKPDYAEAHNNLGNTLKVLGKPEEAASSLSRALQIKPDYAEAHRNLSTVKKYREGDPQTQQMLQLLAQKNLSDEDRKQLNFALGKAHADIGNHDAAFSCLFEGNRLRRAELKFEISTARTSFESIKSTFLEDIPASSVAEELTDEKKPQPVFILGMPRSGTSLVEQILASHSQVYGAGEMGLLGQAVNAFDWTSSQLSVDQLQSIRMSYLSGLTKIGASESYVTDKMPINFLWIGFIISAIPGAKIIHVKRDARATCWSNFKSYYSHKVNGFAYDLRDVAEYYKMYIDLMAFWHQKFPGLIYDLNYEALTENQESDTRKLLKYIGLDWEDRCLEFYKTERAVQTASAMQVRQEMYQGSSEEWRNYEKHLELMIELLKGV